MVIPKPSNDIDLSIRKTQKASYNEKKEPSGTHMIREEKPGENKKSLIS